MNTRSPGFISSSCFTLMGRVSYIYAWFHGPMTNPNSDFKLSMTRRTKPQQSRNSFDLYSGSENGNEMETLILVRPVSKSIFQANQQGCRPYGSPRHKRWPAGPGHFSDRRTSSGQYILSFTGPYGPPRYMSGHQISNSAGPNDDKSQYVLFVRAPVPHLGSFRAFLLLQRDASVSRVGVGHVTIKHTDVSV